MKNEINELFSNNVDNREYYHDTSNDNNGTNINRFCTFTDSSLYRDGSNETRSYNEKIIFNEIDHEDLKKDLKNEIIINIYRYKITNEFMSDLFVFSKIHQYDKRSDFKEAWEKWMIENSELIDSEIRRITNLGYDGNIVDKMYKSARYYFRKKSTEKKAPKERRTYINIQKELLNSIDDHILKNINNNDYKPSEAFKDFCSENIDSLREEVNNLVSNGFKNANEIKEKFKKTYKNRYFILTNK